MTQMLEKATRPDADTVGALPSLWIFAREYGKFSHVWMRRQVALMKSFKPTVLEWSDSVPPLENSEVIRLTGRPDPQQGPQRWLTRLSNLAAGNYYAGGRGDRREFQNLAKQIPPDAALCHFGQQALRVLPIMKELKVPVVVHFHGQDLSSALSNRWYRSSLLRHVMEFDAIVVVGEHQRQRVIGFGVPVSRVHVIPCGVPTAEFRLDKPRSANSGAIRFMTLGRLEECKGLNYVISAIQRLQEEKLNVELHVVGDGPLRQPLEQLTASLPRPEAVRFFGAQSPSNVVQLFQEVDVFVQHSITTASGWVEGFGVSISEAMAMELPVIGTRSGGIPDQVVDHQTGILVAERDVKALAAAMRLLATDGEARQRLGAAGRDRAVAHFNTPTLVGKLEHVIHSCLGNPVR